MAVEAAEDRGRKVYKKALALFALCLALCSSLYIPRAASEVPATESLGVVEDYVIGPEDVLEILVWDNPDLSGKFQVSLDGFLNYQLLGRVKAGGLMPAELAASLKTHLADGFLIDPQVTVRVSDYKSKKIFVIGEANRPGTYYLTKKTTVVEAVAMAGGPAKNSNPEVIIVRPGQGSGGEALKLTVNLRRALEGEKKENPFVESGDSLFILKSDSFYITGEVRKPGQYDLEKGTTVLKAISIAGGSTEKASLGRTKIVRLVKDEEEEISVDLNDTVMPNDTIIVPQSYF